MTLLATVYCTQADVERIISTQGVVAFSDHDDNGVADEGVIDDCINEATTQIDFYCWQRYAASDLSTNAWVNNAAATLATHALCELRGNPVPESLQKKCDELIGLLEKIHDGKYAIPRLAFSSDIRPTFSNLTVDRRYARSKIRVTQRNSSDQTTTNVRRNYADEPIIDNG